MAATLRARSLRHLRIRGRNDSGEENVSLDLSRVIELLMFSQKTPILLQIFTMVAKLDLLLELLGALPF
ncbi:hypothetical protein DUI87_06588 [Hirundo rustica rustica]|uniref:Uncharacterized protein n=1 Tax=Hirundo rustica rustica TaxID=333673 RepID=A0A3M0KTK9_HIRRU|nr:hypothetical protein DUI87_06588 [Hirundo rustica rustica]